MAIVKAKTKTTKDKQRSAAPARKLQKAEHGTSLLTAFREIRDMIVRGKMSPGTWILEADLAERLNMSRTPVRAAIHWLQREGYVIEHRNVSKSRMIVAPLTKEDANELYLIIGHVEGIAGRGVAHLPQEKRMELAAELTRLNQRLHTIADGRGGEPGEIFDLDRSFHDKVIAAGGGPRIRVLHEAIVPQTERYWRLYASCIITNLHTSVQEHERIIRGIVSGDAGEIEIGLQQNWLQGAERLGHVIDIFGERGSW